MKAVDTNELMRATLKEHTTSTDQYSLVPTSGARSMSAFHAIAQFLIATNRLEDERDPLHIKLRDDLNLRMKQMRDPLSQMGHSFFHFFLRRLKMLNTVVHINLFDDTAPVTSYPQQEYLGWILRFLYWKDTNQLYSISSKQINAEDVFTWASKYLHSTIRIFYYTKVTDGTPTVSFQIFNDSADLNNISIFLSGSSEESNTSIVGLDVDDFYRPMSEYFWSKRETLRQTITNHGKNKLFSIEAFITSYFNLMHDDWPPNLSYYNERLSYEHNEFIQHATLETMIQRSTDDDSKHHRTFFDVLKFLNTLPDDMKQTFAEQKSPNPMHWKFSIEHFDYFLENLTYTQLVPGNTFTIEETSAHNLHSASGHYELIETPDMANLEPLAHGQLHDVTRDTTLGLNSFITAYNKTICQNEDVNTTDLDERFDDEYLINPQRVFTDDAPYCTIIEALLRHNEALQELNDDHQNLNDFIEDVNHHIETIMLLSEDEQDFNFYLETLRDKIHDAINNPEHQHYNALNNSESLSIKQILLNILLIISVIGGIALAVDVTTNGRQTIFKTYTPEQDIANNMATICDEHLGMIPAA